MRQPVTSPDQVAANIRRFAEEVARSPELQAKLGHVHAWYALRLDGGGWSFGPSKFVGYPDNTARRYLATYRNEADGRRTEHALTDWFSPIDPGSRLGIELMEALRSFLARWDRVPRRGARISVVSVDGDDIGAGREIDRKLLDRISVNPTVCGGRPCIRGTRVRVTDVLDMLAHGATREEILADYPYLAADDIAAALAYAAQAADHRVIRAA